MALKTTAWDAADHLKSPGDIAAYVQAVFDEGDPTLIAAALGDVARSQGMTALAKKTGVSRAALYRALGSNGNPTLSTLLSVIKALGLKLQTVPEKAA
jgi:probable addiction module antidote protein